MPPQGQDQNAKQAAVPAVAPEPAVPAEAAVPAVPAVPATTFTSAGKIPAVAPAAASTAAPAAAAPTASQMAYGAGVTALTALIAKGGTPDPKAVVDLIDAHRDEHDAMMSLLTQKLGATYVTQVQSAMGLRASVARKEVVAGDPADPKADSFIASAADQDVKWRAANGNFTGTIDKNGLDSSVNVDPNDTLHADVKTDKSATLDWNHDGKTEVEAYGSYKDSKDYDAGVRHTWAAGTGQLTTSADHSVAAGTATDAAIASYKSADGKTTATGKVGVEDGKAVESAQGQFAPTANSTVNASVANDPNKGGVSGQVGGSYNLGTSTKLDGNVTRSPTSTAVNADATEKLSSAWSLTEKATETIPDSGKATTTGSIAATYKEGTTTADASATRNATSTALHADGSEQIDSKWKLNQKLDLTLPDAPGQSQLVASAGETYTSGNNLAETASVEGGVGPNQYIKATGEVDEGLGNGFYASQWGSYSATEGKQDTAQAGASITFTPDEKNALTLAGLVDQNGAFETRLEYDVFKSKVDSVSGLSDAKKNALVSLFVSYRSDSGAREMDDRYGAPDLDMGAGQQVTAGIRISF